MPIDFGLTSEQQRLKDTCRELAEDFETRSLAHDAERSIPVENFARLREAGLFGLAIPAALGGMGGGALEWVLAAEEIAARDGATALGFNMHINATGGIVRTHEEIPAAAKERVARLAVDEGALMCTSVSEPTTSSLLPASYAPAVQARRADGGWTLHGRKFFTSIFEAADYCYLYAHPEDVPNPMHAVALLVPTGQDGIAVNDIWDTHGMRATRSNQVDYDGAFVPEELTLYETEDFLGSFIIEEASWAFGGYVGCYMGVAAGIVEWAKRFLGSRTAKGYTQEMGYHPDISRRVGQAVADVEAARLAVYRAAWESDVNGPSPAAFARWVEAKYTVGAAMQRISAAIAPACGVHGLFRQEGLEVKLRDGATAPIMPPNADAAAEMVGLLAMGLDPGQAPTLRQVERRPEPAAV
jgi:alkylation response protein AidB-like acyl-CoA dehydrogenase